MPGAVLRSAITVQTALGPRSVVASRRNAVGDAAKLRTAWFPASASVAAGPVTCRRALVLTTPAGAAALLTCTE